MVKTIKPKAFEVELQGNPTPLLVAFLKRNERFSSQAKVLEETEAAFGERLRCFLFNSDYLDTAMERFKVKGTPTYLLFEGGREVDRLIGASDDETMDEFVRSFIDN